MKRLLATIALLAAIATPAFAQVDRATVTGIVKDSGGASVPGATVTVTNIATNVATTQQSNEAGSYLVVNLIPGQYRVDVELSGFKKVSQSITLEVGQRSRMDVTLAVGNVNETVTVTETTPLINNNDANLGSVIPQMQVSTCRWRSATGMTCSRSFPACSRIVTPSRAAARRSAVPAGSTSTAHARCRTTSSSTEWTTTAFQRTSRN
jgi:opacity protein-like surface antigen